MPFEKLVAMIADRRGTFQNGSMHCGMGIAMAIPSGIIER